MTFLGSEEEATVVINNSGCSDFVRNFVTYLYDSNGVYSNGDTLTVYAIWGDNFTADDRDVYVFTTDSKEYEISGLIYFPKTKDIVANSTLMQVVQS